LGQVPQMPERFSADKTLVERVKYSSKNFNLSFDTGLIGTGDSFIGKPDQAQLIKDFFPVLVVVAIEAASIAQIFNIYHTPFVIIRSLSDIAGKDSSISSDEFLQKSSANSANVIIETIKNYKNKPAI